MSFRVPASVADPIDRGIAFLELLCGLSSPSGDAAGIAAAAALLAAGLEPYGFACEIRTEADVDGRELPLLVAARPGRALRGPKPGRPLLLIGHLDTVLPAAPARREAERLFATGAIDMKGGFAAFVTALALLETSGVEPPPDLLFVAVPDEEVAGAISRRATARFGAAARAFWVLEPGERRERSETIVVGRRGLFSFRLEARGRAAHSGLAFFEGRSAVAAATEWCANVDSLSRRGGPTVNLSRIVGGDAELVGDLAGQAALFGSVQRLNIVPDRAIVEGEARFAAEGDRVRVSRRLDGVARRIAARRGVELSLEISGHVKALPSRGVTALSRRAVALAARRGWKLELERDRGGISFPNFLPDPRAIPVLDGLGPAGGGMHTRGEFVALESFARRAILLADLLAEESAALSSPVEASATAPRRVAATASRSRRKASTPDRTRSR